MGELCWQKGRQGTGYEKLPLLVSKRFGFDVYLLRYRPGAYIPWHLDPVPGKRHYRLNLVLKKAKLGGDCYYQNARGESKFAGRLHFFRPDVVPHRVSAVNGSVRYVLSIGWVRNNG